MKSLALFIVCRTYNFKIKNMKEPGSFNCILQLKRAGLFICYIFNFILYALPTIKKEPGSFINVLSIPSKGPQEGIKRASRGPLTIK